ncbi:hypothetical protein I7I50_06118 [Histoplasma capsulatum G186AR]|uniref:Uncharacterized protein n=1 Tax=Ajellomyces capsulatus TaxID=5037 RepID=A0A8H8D3F2_AJECA|nr:hypothetical protein I7I52_10804 [Histoplasma capsulatum]QSS67124.1 hypothetical protein I7I50_06118 [Histoplasma capsulatum G186AR]
MEIINNLGLAVKGAGRSEIKPWAAQANIFCSPVLWRTNETADVMEAMKNPKKDYISSARANMMEDHASWGTSRSKHARQPGRCGKVAD